MAILDWFLRIFGVGASPNGAGVAAPPAAIAPPSPTDLASPKNARAAATNASPARGTATDDAMPAEEPATTEPQGLRILMASLQGDRQDQFTKRFADSIAGGAMITVISASAHPAYPGDRPSPAELATLHAEAARILDQEDADILILGSISKATMRLRLIPAKPPLEARADAFGYADALLIPPNFDATLATLAYASVIAAGMAAKPEQRAALAPHLIAAAEKCVGLMDASRDDLSEEQKASVMTHLGVVATNVWRMTGKAGSLDVAAAAYQRAVSDGPREVQPTVLAELQIRLGVALQDLARIADAPEKLEEAEAALRSVIGVLNKTSHAREFALANQCLGGLLLRRGQKEMNSNHCAGAVAAFDAALEVFTRAAHPVRWLELMAQRGTAYLAWGTVSAGNEELQQAVEIGRTVLAARNMTSAPVQWAHASSSLGSAAFALAKRTGEASLLKEAAASFDGAVAVYEKHGHAKAVEVLRKNLQRVERLLLKDTG